MTAARTGEAGSGLYSPDAILLTHAHRDHAYGLRDGADCPVYATEQTWGVIGAYPIRDRRVIEPGRRLHVAGISFEAFPVVHSVLAPAVGYRIELASAGFFYVPDVADIGPRDDALADAQLCVGDGATLTRPILRHSHGQLIRHTTVTAQLDWCREAGVPRAIFTHCGSEIVRGEPAAIDERVAAMGVERGIDARIASDGLQMWLRQS